MKFDSKQQALKYHREFFSSLYDVDTYSSTQGVPPATLLTPGSECGILEWSPLSTPVLHPVTLNGTTSKP